MTKIGHAIYLVIITILIVVLYSINLGVIKQDETIENQENKISELYITIGEYQNNEDWFEDYIDLLIEIYNKEIEIAVLEERTKWLETDFAKEYTTNEMYIVIDNLLRLAVEDQQNETVTITYDEETQQLTLTQYNYYGEINDVDIYTLDDIIHEILGGIQN